VISFVAGCLVASPDAGSLTIFQAVEEALERHPSVAASEAGLRESKAALGEARASLWPSLRASASATRHEEPFPVVPIHGFTPGAIPPFDRTLVQAQIQASWTLLSGGRRIAQIRGARAQAEGAEATLEEARQALVAQVVATYLDVVAEKEILAAHRHRVTALEVELSRVTKLLEQGRAARVERLRAEAALADAEAEAIRSSSALSIAEEDLARLLLTDVERTRASALRDVALADTLVPEREGLLARALERSPAIRRAHSREAAARSGRMLARSARWPDLRLAGTHTGYGDGEGIDTGEWSASLQTGVTLWSGGAVKKGIERSDAIHRAALEQVRLTETEIGGAVDRGRAQAIEAAARVRSLSKALAAREEVVRIERLLLEAGTGTQSEYLDAEADLLSARANLIEARRLQIRAHLETVRLQGDLDLDGLRRSVESR
jgi:outer membrane protein TolC